MINGFCRLSLEWLKGGDGFHLSQAPASMKLILIIDFGINSTDSFILIFCYKTNIQSSFPPNSSLIYYPFRFSATCRLRFSHLFCVGDHTLCSYSRISPRLPVFACTSAFPLWKSHLQSLITKIMELRHIFSTFPKYLFEF